MDVVSYLPKGGPMAQVRVNGPRVGGCLVLFCIHRVNRVYGALVVTSWTLLRRLINCRIIIIISGVIIICQRLINKTDDSNYHASP